MMIIMFITGAYSFLLQQQQQLLRLSPHGNYFCDKKSGEFVELATPLKLKS